MNDGQGVDFIGTGVPFRSQTVNAPAGSDALAILALATPTQTTASTSPIDLEFSLPPGIALASDASECAQGLSSEIIVGVIISILVAAFLVRR